MFTATLGSPRSPSDPCCGYPVFHAQTVKVNDALSRLPCRAAGSGLCSGGLLLSPAGHPQHGFRAAPALEAADGTISCHSKARGGTIKIFSLALLVM